MNKDNITTEENIEYEDVRSANDMIRSNPDIKGIKKKKEINYSNLILKYIGILFICYLVYLLGSSFINYGKDGDLLIEVVTENRSESTEIERYRLYTSGVVEKVNTNGKSELSLGQIMLLNLYGKTIYRLALNTTADSTENYQHIYVFNSSGDVIKEYEGKEMFYNKPITNWVYAESTEELDLIGE